MQPDPAQAPELLLYVAGLLFVAGAILGVLAYHPKIEAKASDALGAVGNTLLGLGGSVSLWSLAYYNGYEDRAAWWFWLVLGLLAAAFCVLLRLVKRANKPSAQGSYAQAQPPDSDSHDRRDRA